MKKIILVFLLLTTMIFSADFEKSVTKTLNEEGSDYYYSAIHGERSKYGIRNITLKYFNKKFNTDWYVKELKKQQAIMIYYEMYWGRIREIRNQDLANNLFDFGANSGPGKATKILQETINKRIRQKKIDKTLKVDGVLGTRTIAMINKYCDKKLIIDYKKNRLKFLRTLKSKWKNYGNTWTRRVKAI